MGKWNSVAAAICLVAALITGCTYFRSRSSDADVPVTERPYIALLPFGIEQGITTLSAVKSLEDTPSPKEEAREVAEVINGVLTDARWLLLSRLATSRQFRFVPLEETDAVALELDLKRGVLPTPEQLSHLRQRLKADLVVATEILEYGKIRWQWFVTGAFAELSLETVVIGLASAWNPAILLANVGIDLLVNSVLLFGGGYLFGIAFRPVIIEARAFETLQGNPIWQGTEGAFYARGALKQLPVPERGKKESQLRINLGTAMEALADSLVATRLVVSDLTPMSAESKGECIGATCGGGR